MPLQIGSVIEVINIDQPRVRILSKIVSTNLITTTLDVEGLQVEFYHNGMMKGGRKSIYTYAIPKEFHRDISILAHANLPSYLRGGAE